MTAHDIAILAAGAALFAGLVGYAVGWLGGFESCSRLRHDIDQAERMKAAARRHEFHA